MKKITLLAAMAVCGFGAANAQYVGDAGIAATSGNVYYTFSLDAATVESLTTAGKTVYSYPIDNETINFWVWDNTFTAGEATYPGVDLQMDGYTSLVVGTSGWSGAGFDIEGNGADLSGVTDDYHFHIAFRSSNAPSSIAVIFGDGNSWTTQALATAGEKAQSTTCAPAKISIGSEAFNDNGTVYPLVGALDADGEWVAIDIKLSDMKKLYPSFAFTPGFFRGNIYSVLAGGVTGKELSIDAVYIYGTPDGSVEGIAADESQIVVSAKTISAINASSIELYNVAGQLVRKADSSIMGTEGLSGLYIVKAGNAVKKVVLK